jgi:protein SCO1/2
MTGRDGLTIVLLGLSAVLVTGLAITVVTLRAGEHATPWIRPSGIPASVSTPTADLMGLSPLPGAPAPGFILVDQHGLPLSLGSLRGQVVILGFSDPHCTDVCPIVSAELLDAYRLLGRAAPSVEFVSVNVNPFVTGVGATARYSMEHQLDTIPTWHFVTGAVASLQEVWHAYGIEVDAPSPQADVIHTDALYFIDRSGRIRFLATPTVDHSAAGASYLPAGQLASWGQGIADLGRYLSGR